MATTAETNKNDTPHKHEQEDGVSILEAYEEIVGKDTIDALKQEAQPLHGKRVVHVNSTRHGGGVAEILHSLVPLLNELGVHAEWDVVQGSPDFFTITKNMHNALQGEQIPLSGADRRLYEETIRENGCLINIAEADVVINHDPQPAPLAKQCKQDGQPWAWRCHIDLSSPSEAYWEYLRPFVEEHDVMVVSKNDYQQPDCSLPQTIIRPSINALNDKNRDLSEEETDDVLAEFDIPRDKPLITQVSRFDKWKDPLGVIDAYRLVREDHDCRLVLLGSMADDDPEGQEIYEQVCAAAGDDEDITVINFNSELLVNALQRESDVIIQKSLREGFGLTVTEALWKATPVVAGNVGGIPLQVKHGQNGYLVGSVEECAQRVKELLDDPDKAKAMGATGREYVREHFLIVRHAFDYVRLCKTLLGEQSLEALPLVETVQT